MAVEKQKRRRPQTLAREEARETELDERAWEAWQLRRDGKNYRDIGRLLDVSHETARAWCKRARAWVLDDHKGEIEQDRAEQLDRLFGMYEVAMQRYRAGDANEGTIAVRVLKEISDITGIKIQKVEHTGKDGTPLGIVVEVVNGSN